MKDKNLYESTELWDADPVQAKIHSLVQQALEHPIVKETVEQYMKNMKMSNSGLPAMGLEQCMMSAAIIAICNEQRIDPRVIYTRWDRT